MDLKIYWLDEDSVAGESELPSIKKSKSIVVVDSIKKVNKVVELAVKN